MDEAKPAPVVTRVAPSRDRPTRYVGTASLPDGSRRIALGSGVITALISKGGSAVVYEIWNSQLEVSRAVKLLHPDRLEESKERFETEVKITAKLHHPNIVEIYVVGNWNGLPYIEMERVDGITLEQLITKRGALPVEVCTSIGILVARALDYAHNQKYMIYGKEYVGIIHRDLKPANVMIGRDGVIKLMDFGIAKPVSARSETSEGIVVGTMQYLSPEQLQGDLIDVRADVYSLGTVLYELLTGQRTFPEKNLAKLVTDKLNNRFQSLDKFAVEIPGRLKRLVHHCLHFQKAKRIQSAAQLLKDLETIHRTVCEESPEQVLKNYIKVTDDTRTVVARRWLPQAAAIIQAAALLAFLGAGIFLYFQVRRAMHPASLTPPPATAPAPAQAAPQATPQVQPPPAASAPAETATNWEPMADSAPVAAASAAKESLAAERRRALVETVERGSGGSAVRSAPLQPAPAAATPQDDLIDRLRVQYGTADLSTLMEREVLARNYATALQIYQRMALDMARSKKALVYRLKALQGANDQAGLTTFLLSQTVDDAEFYVAKSLYFSGVRDPEQAQAFYQKSLRAVGEFIDPTSLEQKRMLCRAVWATGAYEGRPSDATRKEAMDAWYEIKLRLQRTPDHKLYQRADAEIRRISGTTGAGG
jgi:serine/threonine-protein kinase